MENEKMNDFVFEIDSLNIKDYLKKELYFFNEKMQEILEKKGKFDFNIVIDNICISDINILLEYIVDIIRKRGLYDEFIKYRCDTKNLLNIKNSVIVVDDFNIFRENIINTWGSQRKFNEFFVQSKLNNNIVILTCPSDIKRYIGDINSILFDLKSCIYLKGKINERNLYDELINRYNKNNIKYNLSYGSFKKIVDGLNSDYYVKCFDIIDYIYDYSIKRLVLENSSIVNLKTFGDFVEVAEKTPGISRCKKNDDIEDLIGLGNVKEELNGLYNYLDFIKKNKLNNKDMYLNMFFLGNPGTGKTTVARMYAKNLFKLGLIKSPKVVEITPNDLMGEYVGHTRDVIRSIFNKAEEGLLFIDEAYLIDDDLKKGNSFMNEALIELLKYLENPKHIVIFAGYCDKMKSLYDNNPGIKSRIYKEIVFDDYSSLELYKILDIDLQNHGLKINEKSKKKIINYINNLKNDINFGNARTIKNLAQKMIMNHANRKLKADNLLIDSLDLPKEGNTNTLRMGFGVYDN